MLNNREGEKVENYPQLPLTSTKSQPGIILEICNFNSKI